MEDRRHHADSGVHHRDNANEGIVLTLLVCALIGIGIYLLLHRYHVRKEQLIEGGIYLFCLLGSAYTVIHYWTSYKEKRKKTKPRLRCLVTRDEHERNLKEAFKQNSVIPGYDAATQKPVLWSDEVRTMQSILAGKSGFGKSTFLRNLILQDARRVVEIDGSRRHIPQIILDGKGDQEFVDTLIEDLAAIGRLQDVRLLDPSRSELSVRYNALHQGSDETYQEHVNFIFESLGLAQDFFKGHQATYFSDLVRVLEHTGKQYNTYDVLVVAFDPIVMNEQIEQAIWRAESETGVTVQQRLNLQMSVRNLRESLRDQERITKIQGLLNPLMTFLEDELSVLTGSYDQLLTLSDVFDEDLILIVALNANSNERAIAALGRILLKNLQLMVGKRYSTVGRTGRMQMASVILDEFASFAYPTFPRILETARGSNVSLLFSVQSVAQLEAIGPSFRAHVTAAPNTIMLMQSWDRASAEYFQQAAPSISVEQLTEGVEDRGWFQKNYAPTGKAQSRIVEEPRVARTEIGSLPRAQMHLLMADTRGEPRYSHLLVPAPSAGKVRTFKPTVYPPIPSSNWLCPNGANLRFADMRRLPRISGRRA